jgi:hypothetical protein
MLRHSYHTAPPRSLYTAWDITGYLKMGPTPTTATMFLYLYSVLNCYFRAAHLRRSAALFYAITEKSAVFTTIGLKS